MLEERVKVFEQFRKADWQINVIEPVSRTASATESIPVLARDNDHRDRDFVHYLVKMPGAAAARVRTWTSVLRLLKGVEHADF